MNQKEFDAICEAIKDKKDVWGRLANEAVRLAAEVAELKAGMKVLIDAHERDEKELAAEVAAKDVQVHELKRFLYIEGYEPCNVAACNCGSWHKRSK